MASVGRPDGRFFLAWTKAKARHGIARDLVNPDVISVLADRHGKPPSIGRKTRVFENPSRLCDGSNGSRTVYPNEGAFSRDRENVDERAVRREGEMRGSIGRVRPDSLQNGDGLTRQFETPEIEERSQKRPFPREDQVTRRDIS